MGSPSSQSSGSGTGPPILVQSAESDSDAVSFSSVASSSKESVTWSHIVLGDLVQSERLVVTNSDATVESAFNTLQKYELTCLPISRNGSVYDTFDYADLNGYLLLVLGHISVKGAHGAEFDEALRKAQQGIPATVEFASQFGARDPFVRMSTSTSLGAAIQKFASGVHRIAIVGGPQDHVVGILSQRRLIKYIWNNIRKFPQLEPVLDRSLEELQIGKYGDMVTVQGDALVIDALDIMHEKAVSSVAVVDREQNLLGNISVVDVSLLTRAWQAGHLRTTCRHFLTVVLDSRGIHDGGNEPVPVFFVHRSTSVSKVIAKLVATEAHRLWITEQVASDGSELVTSGRLVGVVALTDIMNFVARQSGRTLDPEAARRHRRSSSSSVRSNSRVRHQILMDGSPLERPRLSFDRPSR